MTIERHGRVCHNISQARGRPAAASPSYGVSKRIRHRKRTISSNTFELLGELLGGSGPDRDDLVVLPQGPARGLDHAHADHGTDGDSHGYEQLLSLDRRKPDRHVLVVLHE